MNIDDFCLFHVIAAFRMDFPCKGDGITTVSISLRIRNSYDTKDIPGSPLTLQFDKECVLGESNQRPVFFWIVGDWCSYLYQS